MRGIELVPLAQMIEKLGYVNFFFSASRIIPLLEKEGYELGTMDDILFYLLNNRDFIQKENVLLIALGSAHLEIKNDCCTVPYVTLEQGKGVFSFYCREYSLLDENWLKGNIPMIIVRKKEKTEQSIA